MKDLLTYALGVVACSAIFVVFYRTVLHRRTSFRTARIFLVTSLVCAAIIPALDIPVWRVAPIEMARVLTPIVLPEILPDTTAAPVTVIDWTSISFWVLWGVGLAGLTVAMVRQIIRIARIKRRAEVFPLTGCKIALSEEVSSPFSFLGTVFVERGTSDGELKQIVLHEASHIRHHHSQEKIAVEVIKNVLWFNPFGWWTARLLAEVHEFEADRDVLDGGFTVEEYLPLIFRQIFGYNPELSVGLGDSLTKKRFLMMKNKMKLNRYSWLRVAGVLPLAAGMMMLFSFTSRNPEIIYTEVPAAVEVHEAIETAVETIAPAEVEPAAEVSAPVAVAAPTVSPAPQSPEGDTPVYQAEVMPTFQGGDLNTFRNWVMGRIVYPSAAVENNIQGKVTLRFVIERDGSLSNIETISSPDKLLTDAAIAAIKDSPKWTPGKIKDKTVRVSFNMPIEFTLTGDNKEPAKSANAPVQNPDGNTPVYLADEMPTFQSGDLNTFRDWVMGRIVYPSAAVENNIQGKVTLRFVIERDGSLSNIETISSPDKLLTDAAIAAIKDSPKWMPGKIKDKTVRVIYILPIDFSLVPTTTAETSAPVAEVEENEATMVSRFFKKTIANPLIVLDGKEITQEQMDAIAPDVIQSISVLKGSQATLKYGSRASDGVIEISTKVDLPSRSNNGDEQIDIGYGTISRDRNTGAVSTLDMSAAYNYSSLKEYMMARVPGVAFKGDVLIIRGQSSIKSSNDALILVDGMPIASFAVANAMISPSDVASISVLKDAASAAIYGARGANGVVLISTKKR